MRLLRRILAYLRYRGNLSIMENLEKQCVCKFSSGSGPRIVDVAGTPTRVTLACDVCNTPWAQPIENRIHTAIGIDYLDTLYALKDSRPDPADKI